MTQQTYNEIMAMSIEELDERWAESEYLAMSDERSARLQATEGYEKALAHLKQLYNDVVEENCMLRAELDELRSK